MRPKAKNKNSICKLCLSKKATQTNSHIFPKFMGVSLIETPDGKRKGFKIDDNTNPKQRHFQDTPKEDYLLCPECESDIGALESEFAKDFFHKFKKPKNSKNYTELHSKNAYSYKIVNNVKYENFKITLYTMLWRASVSSLAYFDDLKLHKEVEQEMRVIINEEVDFKDFPLFIVTANHDSDTTKNYIYAFSNSQNDHFLWINEYIICFPLGKGSAIATFFRDIIVKDKEPVKIGVLPHGVWEKLREKLMNIKVGQSKN